MNPDIHQATQELAEQRRSIDEMLHKIKEASRMMDLATHELHKRDARIHDLEIECERLRSQLAHVSAKCEKWETDYRVLFENSRQTRIKQAEQIRRMEEGDL